MPGLRGMRIIKALCKSSHDELIGSLHERCVPVVEVPAWFKAEHFTSLVPGGPSFLLPVLVRASARLSLTSWLPYFRTVASYPAVP